MNFVFVNVDDTKDQFVKTSNSLLKGIQGVNVYGEKGMESDIAKKYGVYGFKLPCFVIVDKDGKIASRSFVNLGEQELVTILDKQTGLSAPKVDPNAQQMRLSCRLILLHSKLLHSQQILNRLRQNNKL
jgi:hypothetical protein